VGESGRSTSDTFASFLGSLVDQSYDGVYRRETSEADKLSLDVSRDSSRACPCETKAIPPAFGADRVVIVNLKRRSDRLQKFAAQIRRFLDVDTEPERMSECSLSRCAARKWRWDAVDGSRLNLSADAMQRLFNASTEHSRHPSEWRPIYPHKWRRGVLGCALSHLSVWTAIVASDLPDDKFWIVFEDDAELVADFDREWRRVLDSLERSPVGAWDLLYLGWTDDRPLYGDIPIDGVNAVRLSGQPRSVGGGTFAYAIKPSAARGLLRHALTRRLSGPVDWFMMSAYGPQSIRAFKCAPHLSTSPHVLFNHSADSDINRRRVT